MEVGSGNTSLTMVGEIHSNTNYEITLGTTHTFFIGGQAYEVLGSLAPQKVTLNQNYFQQQGILAAASAFVDLTKASGVTVKANGNCTVAGEAGESYTETTPSTQGIVNITQVGCVADSNGALLSFVQGTSGTASPGGTAQRFNFEVTGVGNVPLIQLP